MSNKICTFVLGFINKAPYTKNGNTKGNTFS